ncbi:MAG: PAS domain S-box protein, partial [Bacteroidales bacterium]|nr:PAS domain S-box protein [Bacteroidales bacterium]
KNWEGAFKKLEVAYKDSEKKYLELIDLVPIGVFEFDLEGRITHCNPTGLEMLGYTQEDIEKNIPVFNLILPEEFEKVKERISKLYSGQAVEGEEYTAVRKNGNTFPVMLYSDPLFAEDKVIGVRGIAFDLSKSKKIENQLQELLTRYEIMLKSMPDIIFRFDKQGRFIDYHANSPDKLILPPEEFMGKRILDVALPEDIKKRGFEKMKEALKTGEIVIDEMAFQGPDGLNYYEARYIPIGKDEVLDIIRDITDRKQNEENLRKAKEAAEQANKTKGEFISNISHEIRTPLNSIIGFSEMLTGHLENLRLKEYAGSIRSAGNSLLMLINDILDLSKIEAGRLDISLEAVELRSLITEISQIFAVKVAKKNLDFVVDVHDDVPYWLMLDKIRIRQVLFNLIGNAVKFTEKGFVRLVVKLIDSETPGGNRDLLIKVEDSGIGIPKESHEAIFDSFVQLDIRADHTMEGTGLGLSITKRLVEMMKGSISLESTPGEGTSFNVILKDVSVADRKADKKGKSEKPCTAFSGKRILLVDDSDINRRFVKDNLEDCGAIVREAENGVEALERTGSFNPDLILMDIMMPVMDGYEAVNKLKADKALSGIPVLAITALAMKEDIERISRSGFDDFLIKPFHINELFEKMKELLFINYEIPGESGPEVIHDDSISEEKYLVSLQEALRRIDKKCLPLWKQANELKEFNSIRTFAEAIHSIGKKLNIRLLVDYGDKLIVNCDNYDIEKIDSNLAAFPEYLKKMKEIIVNRS